VAGWAVGGGDWVDGESVGIFSGVLLSSGIWETDWVDRGDDGGFGVAESGAWLPGQLHPVRNSKINPIINL
jgi:hypothetical protein